MIEFEGKVLDVDPDAIHCQILHAGGYLVDHTNQRRYVYDIVPGDQSRWIRLRDNGDTATLATKHIRHDGIDGTDEVEVTVDDFDTTHMLLQSLGFTAKAYQENLRASYRLHEAALEVGQWPMIPAYLEIESVSREHVVEVAALLGFTEDQLTGENTTKVFARYGIDLNGITNLRF